ncbi:sodium-dependent transporter [bacterium]|nr:sodium-dependent transporter [bacterium]
MKQALDACTQQRFSSRLGLLLSALGIAVGTGNIWRFPRIAAQMGGEGGAGAFIIAWLIFLFIWSIPLIIAEYALGRKYRQGVVGTIASAGGKKTAWMGAFIAFVATAICFFYAVIVGWCIFYFFTSLTQSLPTSTETSMNIWNSFQSSYWPMLTHACAMAFGAWAIWKGVSSIERVNKILIPTLLGIVLLAVIRALTLPGAWNGISYLFTPELSQLAKPRLWLEALTQNAWDTGAGWGLFMTYAAYMRREHSAVKNAFTTGIGNNFVSILAALMIFGTVFAILQTEMGMSRPEILEIMKTSGPASTGLTFIWMPQLFSRMFLGHPLCILFFLGLTFAGFSSLIAMLELPTRILVDKGLKRPTAIKLVVAIIYLMGIPSARSLGFLSNQDFVWSVGLMVSGAFVAITLMRHGISKIRIEEILTDPSDWKLGRWWDLNIKYFISIAASILLIWWFTMASSTDQWWNPFSSFSIATCLAQWAVILTILGILNRWIGENLVYKIEPVHE